MIQPGIVKVEAVRLAKLAAKQEIKDAGLKLTESGKARCSCSSPAENRY
jgi:hypothetical protein